MVEEKMPIKELKAVAQSNARAVLKFWQSVESFAYTEDRKTSVHETTLLTFNTNVSAEDQTEEFKVVQVLSKTFQSCVFSLTWWVCRYSFCN